MLNQIEQQIIEQKLSELKMVPPIDDIAARRLIDALIQNNQIEIVIKLDNNRQFFKNPLDIKAIIREQEIIMQGLKKLKVKAPIDNKTVPNLIAILIQEGLENVIATLAKNKQIFQDPINVEILLENASSHEETISTWIEDIKFMLADGFEISDFNKKLSPKIHMAVSMSLPSEIQFYLEGNVQGAPYIKPWLIKKLPCLEKPEYKVLTKCEQKQLIKGAIEEAYQSYTLQFENLVKQCQLKAKNKYCKLNEDSYLAMLIQALVKSERFSTYFERYMHYNLYDRDILLMASREFLSDIKVPANLNSKALLAITEKLLIKKYSSQLRSKYEEVLRKLITELEKSTTNDNSLILLSEFRYQYPEAFACLCHYRYWGKTHKTFIAALCNGQLPYLLEQVRYNQSQPEDLMIDESTSSRTACCMIS